MCLRFRKCSEEVNVLKQLDCWSCSQQGQTMMMIMIMIFTCNHVSLYPLFLQKAQDSVPFREPQICCIWFGGLTVKVPYTSVNSPASRFPCWQFFYLPYDICYQGSSFLHLHLNAKIEWGKTIRGWSWRLSLSHKNNCVLDRINKICST